MLISSLVFATLVSQPTPEEVKKVVDFYYQGQGKGPVLVESVLCKKIEKEVSHATSVIKKLTKMMLAAANNPNISVRDVVNHPAYQLPGHTGLTSAWRQSVILYENAIIRIFTILRHPFFKDVLVFSLQPKSFILAYQLYLS